MPEKKHMKQLKKRPERDLPVNKKASWIAAVLSVVIIAALWITFEKPFKKWTDTIRLDIMKYVSIDFFGEDGNGQMSYSYDLSSFALDIWGRGNVPENAYTTLKNIFDSGIISDGETINLKNGDEITIRFTMKNELEKLTGKRFRGSIEKTYTVSGLK